MTEATITVANKPAWIELSSDDPAASRDFYAKLFGWQIEVSPDPQYGGYAIARLGGEDAAGIGSKQSAEAPNAWGIYIGTDDVDGLAAKVEASGGTVVAPPFDVGDQGRMAVFQDPVGAIISAWQGARMGGFAADQANSFGWAELSARGVEKAIPFYEAVFGWTHTTSEAEGDFPPYTEFKVDGASVAGAFEANAEVPTEVPSFWTVYFGVDDVDGAFQHALRLGAQELVAPQDFPGGRFAMMSDPQGAAFALLKTEPA